MESQGNAGEVLQAKYAKDRVEVGRYEGTRVLIGVAEVEHGWQEERVKVLEFGGEGQSSEQSRLGSWGTLT